MSFSNKYRVLIVGCGNIGGRFDFTTNTFGSPQTHAGAYLNHPGFHLSACLDLDSKKLIEFAEKFKIKNKYTNLDQIEKQEDFFDVISICSPTNQHFKNIQQSLRFKPKLIFCEKPISYSLNEAKKIKSICENANIPVAVNLSRRFDPRLIDLKEKILNKSFGELRTVIGIYNKGILNNGIHFIDLMNYLFDEIKIIHVGNPIKDYLESDPTIPLLMENNQKVPIYLATSFASDYSIFEIQFLFSKCSIIIEDGGQTWRIRDVEESNKFKGYKYLNRGYFTKGGDSNSMSNAIDNIYRFLSYGENLKSTIDDAISAQIFCEEVKIRL
tara:strand:- start:290 stop:1270 length:981 start_codon:yes stop_codon:yes gene_type:complete